MEVMKAPKMIIMMIGLNGPNGKARTRMIQMVSQGFPCMNLLLSSRLTNQLKAPFFIAMPMEPMQRTSVRTVAEPNVAAMTWVMPNVKPAETSATRLGHSMSMVIQP